MSQSGCDGMSATGPAGLTWHEAARALHEDTLTRYGRVLGRGRA
jgi:hypothetical protein